MPFRSRLLLLLSVPAALAQQSVSPADTPSPFLPVTPTPQAASDVLSNPVRVWSFGRLLFEAERAAVRN
jgi:hypothetical protein